MASDKRGASSGFMPMVAVETGRFHYSREFETVAQRQANVGVSAGNPYRARSFSTGIYDPSTNMRTNRSHVHMDNLAPNGGIPAPKPPAAGMFGGVEPVQWAPEVVHVPMMLPPVQTPPKSGGGGGTGGTGGGTGIAT